MAQQGEFAGGGLGVSCDNHVGRLTLIKPDKKNAIDAAMWSELPQALDWLTDTAGARCIVISGAGDNFSAGADIGEFDTLRRDLETAKAYDALNAEAFRAMRVCDVPVIALIRGICYGGGFGIAAACDLRLASDDARFAIPAARIGLAYPVEAVPDFIEALGAQAAKRLLYTAGAIDATEARRLGFLMAVHGADQVENEAMALAASIAANAPLTVHASKVALRAALSGHFEDTERALKLNEATFESADYAEGRAAFRDKRRPIFTGS